MVALATFAQPIPLDAVKDLLKRADRIEDAVLRLGTGERILFPSEDIASLSLARRMQVAASSTREGLKNNITATSLLGIASEALSRISGKLDELQVIATQATDTSLLASQRGFLQTQFEDLIEEIDEIADDTEFEGKKLLDGSLDTTPLTFQLSASTSDTITIAIDSAASTDLFNGATPTLITANDADAAVDTLADAADALRAIRTQVDADLARLDYADRATQSLIAGYEDSAANAGDTDVSAEGIDYLTLLSKQDASLIVLSQSRRMSDGLIELIKISGARAAS